MRFFNDTNITIELPLNIDTVRNKQHGNENEHVSVTIRPLVRANIFRMELETRFANRNIFRRNYRYWSHGRIRSDSVLSMYTNEKSVRFHPSRAANNFPILLNDLYRLNSSQQNDYRVEFAIAMILENSETKISTEEVPRKLKMINSNNGVIEHRWIRYNEFEKKVFCSTSKEFVCFLASVHTCTWMDNNNKTKLKAIKKDTLFVCVCTRVCVYVVDRFNENFGKCS